MSATSIPFAQGAGPLAVGDDMWTLRCAADREGEKLYRVGPEDVAMLATQAYAVARAMVCPGASRAQFLVAVLGNLDDALRERMRVSIAQVERAVREAA